METGHILPTNMCVCVCVTVIMYNSGFYIFYQNCMLLYVIYISEKKQQNNNKVNADMSQIYVETNIYFLNSV
jgi:hypothetical protein